jgi:hypothetical protein
VDSHAVKFPSSRLFPWTVFFGLKLTDGLGLGPNSPFRFTAIILKRQKRTCRQPSSRTSLL